MADSNPDYKKLRGRGYTRGLFKQGGTWRLWLGSDHLLSVKSMSYSESYRRFYFRDIQAIIISQTAKDKVYSVIWGTLCLLCVLLAATQGPVWAIVGGTFFVVFAVLLGINLWRGPTAKCIIRTAVQTEELPSLSRVHVAQEVLQIIKPLIEQAQGRLDAQQMPQIVDQVPQVTAPKAVLSRAEERLTTYNGRAHEMLFYFLILCALISGVDLAMHAEPLVVFKLIFIVGVLLAGFFAAIKQHRTNMTPELKRVTWISFTGVAVLLYGIFMGANISHSMRHPGVLDNGTSLGDFAKVMGNWIVNLISIVFCAPLGVLGIYRLSEFRTNLKTILQEQAANAEAEAQIRANMDTRVPSAAVPIPPVAPIPEEMTTTSSPETTTLTAEPPAAVNNSENAS
jgi:hypothetical protein